MSILTKVLCSVLVFHSCILWGRMTTKTPSPVTFETNHPAPLAFWIASEYGAIALQPKPSRKQKTALALDQLFGVPKPEL
jgi:hypothetical protein